MKTSLAIRMLPYPLLPFSDYVPCFVPLNRSPSRWVRKEPQTRLDLSLHKPMILLDIIAHILAGTALAFVWQEFVPLQDRDNSTRNEEST